MLELIIPQDEHFDIANATLSVWQSLAETEDCSVLLRLRLIPDNAGHAFNVQGRKFSDLAEDRPDKNLDRLEEIVCLKNAGSQTLLFTLAQIIAGMDAMGKHETTFIIYTPQRAFLAVSLN